jgi:formylglycine-generating enzyme required for sulfatase activity
VQIVAIEPPLPPVLSNVTSGQRAGTRDVEIFYDLTTSDPCHIGVDYSLDGGTTWHIVAADDITGGAGAGIGSATARRIQWDITSDFGGQPQRAIDLRVTADDGNLTVMLGPSQDIPLLFRRIPAGSFLMGSDDDANETPQHTVTISQDFYIGQHEITQAQWLAITDPAFVAGQCETFNNNQQFANPSHHWGDCQRPLEGGNDFQGFFASWNAIMGSDGYINRLNIAQSAVGTFSLPTEAQWEYACRATTTSDYNNGLDATGDGTGADSNLDFVAAYLENAFEDTYPVGARRPNSWGLYDMHGNVAEWCLDGLREYTEEPVTDPVGVSADARRVVRGGGFHDEPKYCRSAARSTMPTHKTNASVGLRVVATDVTPAVVTASSLPLTVDGSYYLTLVSNYDGIANLGDPTANKTVYADGEVATWTLTTPVAAAVPDKRYVATTLPDPITMYGDQAVEITWKTQYYLRTTTFGTGAAVVAQDWYDRGSNVTIDADFFPSFSFGSWGGDIDPEDQIDGERITVFIYGPRDIVENFDVNNAIDVDEDGLPDGWEQLHFGGLVTAGRDDGVYTDVDEDALNDLVEFQGGTDPNRSATRLTTGWNMISTPWQVDDDLTLAGQVRDAPIDIVWYWDRRFIRVDGSDPEHAHLLPGYGYFVHAGEELLVEFPGELPTVRTRVLKRGWNLVGAVNSGTIADNSAISGGFWMFDGATYQSTGNEVERFRGYWVYANSETTIELP